MPSAWFTDLPLISVGLKILKCISCIFVLPYIILFHIQTFYTATSFSHVYTLGIIYSYSIDHFILNWMPSFNRAEESECKRRSLWLGTIESCLRLLENHARQLIPDVAFRICVMSRVCSTRAFTRNRNLISPRSRIVRSSDLMRELIKFQSRARKAFASFRVITRIVSLTRSSKYLNLDDPR